MKTSNLKTSPQSDQRRSVTGYVAHQHGRRRDNKIRGSLDCSDHALMEFTILREIGQVKSRVRVLNFRRANFQFFKELVDMFP